MRFNPDAQEFSRFLQGAITRFYERVYKAEEGDVPRVTETYVHPDFQVSMELTLKPTSGPKFTSWRELKARRLTQLDSEAQDVLDFLVETEKTPQEGA